MINLEDPCDHGIMSELFVRKCLDLELDNEIIRTSVSKSDPRQLLCSDIYIMSVSSNSYSDQSMIENNEIGLKKVIVVL